MPQAFHSTVFKAMVLSAGMEYLKCKDSKSMRQRMRSTKYVDMMEWISAKYLDLRTVSCASEVRGSNETEKMQRQVGQVGGSRRGRGINIRDLIMGPAGLNESDMMSIDNVEGKNVEEPTRVDAEGSRHNQLRENASLCMQHLAMSQLLALMVREGDSGALVQLLNMLTGCFHGTNNHKYAAELLEQTIKRNLKWTPLYKSVFLNSCLLNMSGRPRCCMSLDEACEITVDGINNDYNPRGSLQSTEFHINVLSPNINLLRVVRNNVMRKAAAAESGSRSGIPSNAIDVQRLCASMMEEGIFIETPGRVAKYMNAGGQKTELRHYTVVSDAFGDWWVELRNHKFAEALDRRVKKACMFAGAEMEVDNSGAVDWDSGMVGTEEMRAVVAMMS